MVKDSGSSFRVVYVSQEVLRVSLGILGLRVYGSRRLL